LKSIPETEATVLIPCPMSFSSSSVQFGRILYSGSLRKPNQILKNVNDLTIQLQNYLHFLFINKLNNALGVAHWEIKL
jgi:hypothetical protein